MIFHVKVAGNLDDPALAMVCFTFLLCAFLVGKLAEI